MSEHVQPDLPQTALATMIVDQHDQCLAMIEDAGLWPPIGTLVELGEPNRDAIVRDVKLQLHRGLATVMVRVEDTGVLLSEDEAAGASRAVRVSEVHTHQDEIGGRNPRRGGPKAAA